MIVFCAISIMTFQLRARGGGGHGGASSHSGMHSMHSQHVGTHSQIHAQHDHHNIHHHDNGHHAHPGHHIHPAYPAGTFISGRGYYGYHPTYGLGFYPVFYPFPVETEDDFYDYFPDERQDEYY